MSFFVQPTLPPTPKTNTVQKVSLFLAAIIIVMVVAQLFSFEDFPDILSALSLPGGELLAKVWSAIIVTLEVATLPFLLSMVLSPAARIVSMLAGWFSVTGWIVISFWAAMTEGMTNVGFLGATAPLVGGWWTVFIALGLGVLMAWASWGMWPCVSLKRR
jgi:hypothetical protein